MKHISIAIDGPSGAGKSTLARQAAKALGFVYVDTGAIYRTVALHFHRLGVDTADSTAVERGLEGLQVDLAYNDQGVQRMLLNGEDVSDAIRTPEISMFTSAVSALPAVRAFLLEQQREQARVKDVIMDGRDIGTTVLPNATVKIFLTAAAEFRARRRHLELVEKGTDITYEEVLKDVRDRDYNDSHRAVSPLMMAEDAILVDTTHLNLEQSLHELLRVIREGIA